MFTFPFPFYGKIAAEYDESYSLLEMVGGLMKRVHNIENAMQTTNSVINLLTAKIDALTMDVQYIDNAESVTIDIYHNKQYILINPVEKLKLVANHYIHDCNCENCTCDILSKDGFICEIAMKFSKHNDISEIIETSKFEIAWCNDTDISNMNNATVVIWWDGNRFCGAIGVYAEN